MSVQAITWALRQRVRSATHKAVLLVLANRMDPSGFGWPSQKLVAKESQCSDRTVRRVLLDLEADGILIRNDRRRQDGSYTTDAVQFAMPIEPADNLSAGPADNLTDGQIDQRSDTTAPADRLSGLTTFEPNTKNPKKVVGREEVANLPEALASYNEAAERQGWVKVREFTENRRIAARSAWKRLGGQKGWLGLIAAAERQSFLGGANDQQWRMDFDFILKPANQAKILEGKYLTKAERAAEPDAAEQRRRLVNWNCDRTWHPTYGPRPDSPDYRGPDPATVKLEASL